MPMSELAAAQTGDGQPGPSRLAIAANALAMTGLVVAALWRLLFYDAIGRLGFAKSYQFVRRCKRSRRAPKLDTIARVVWAVEEACIWYYKRVYCLQRSAVCTWMLRRCGVDADLVIGFRPAPIDSHAWVEVNGQVVNDRPQYKKFFIVLDRL
jgi:hypothetical protein